MYNMYDTGVAVITGSVRGQTFFSFPKVCNGPYGFGGGNELLLAHNHGTDDQHSIRAQHGKDATSCDTHRMAAIEMEVLMHSCLRLGQAWTGCNRDPANHAFLRPKGSLNSAGPHLVQKGARVCFAK